MYQWFIQQQNAVLPVRLKSFTTTLINGKVELEWITSDEKNNASFTIERAGEDQNFVAIATIPGAGNNTGDKKYSYTDLNPLPDLSFYRLLQTDIDGKKKIFRSKKDTK